MTNLYQLAQNYETARSSLDYDKAEVASLETELVHSRSNIEVLLEESEIVIGKLMSVREKYLSGPKRRRHCLSDFLSEDEIEMYRRTIKEVNFPPSYLYDENFDSENHIVRAVLTGLVKIKGDDIYISPNLMKRTLASSISLSFVGASGKLFYMSFQEYSIISTVRFVLALWCLGMASIFVKGEIFRSIKNPFENAAKIIEERVDYIQKNYRKEND